MISGIIKVEVRLRLITLTETLITPDITKTESNKGFIILYLQVISQFLAGSMQSVEYAEKVMRQIAILYRNAGNLLKSKIDVGGSTR